jgi:hypothetical protein
MFKSNEHTNNGTKQKSNKTIQPLSFLHQAQAHRLNRLPSQLSLLLLLLLLLPPPLIAMPHVHPHGLLDTGMS